MRRIFLMLMLCLAGCASAPPSAVVVQEKVFVDKYLLEPCEPLAIPTVAELEDFDKILLFTKKNTLMYKACNNKLIAAQIVLRRFSNNP